MQQEDSELASVLLADGRREADRAAAAAAPACAPEPPSASTPASAPAPAFKLPATIVGELRAYSSIIAVVVAVAAAAVSVGAGAAVVLEPVEEAPEPKPFWRALLP